MRLQILWMLALPALVSGAPQTRIHSHISDSHTFALKNNTRPSIVRGDAQDEGQVAPSHPMPRMFLHFAMTARQSADLELLLRAQQDRRSQQYHKFLTPEEYAQLFGLAQNDLQKVSRWLEDNGFSDLSVARSRNWISFRGTAEQVESAFHTQIHSYSLHGEHHISNASDPQLPQALQGIVRSIRGLHDFPLRSHLQPRLRPQFTSSSDVGYSLAPDDWETIYDVKALYGAGYDGSGVSIAVVGQSDVQMSDLHAFRSAAGLSKNDPTVVIPTGTVAPGIQSGDEVEADLDLEWAGAIAKNAHIVFVTASSKTGGGVLDAMTYAIDNNLAPIVSTSYSECEGNLSTTAFQTMTDLFRQANAEGITIVAASGDDGATDCDVHTSGTQATLGLAVGFPASSEYVSGIGGTEFNVYAGDYFSSSNNGNNGSALSYIPESVWNDGFQSAGGGGASKLVSKPSWQTGNGVPADNARDVPDLAFAASPLNYGLLICGHNWCANGFRNSASKLEIVGGTSATAPAFAGLLALVIQKNGSSTRLGNINPNLYSLAQISPDAFHDVVSSGNFQNCQIGTPDCTYGDIGFPATAGYDQATGLGSLDAYNFAQEWYGDFYLTSSDTSLVIDKGGSATTTVTVNPQNNFTGDVALSCSVPDSLVDVTCSVSPNHVTNSGPVTVTISATSTASSPFLRLRRWLPPPSARLKWLLPLMLAVFAVWLLRLSWVGSGGRIGLGNRFAGASAGLCLVLVGAVTISCGGAGSSRSTSGGTSGTGTTTETPLSLSCNLGPATAGANYSGQCLATGAGYGTDDFNVTYTVSAGALPAGLKLDAGGLISGIPTKPGTSSFTLRATDNTTPSLTATYAANAFTVGPFQLSVVCSVPNFMLIGEAKNGSCSTIGGTPPVTYSVIAGTLPPGVALNPSTGIFTGSPTDVNLSGYSFTVQATDNGSPAQKATTDAYVSWVTYPSELSMGWTLLPPAQYKTPYDSSVYALGGYPPYTYAVVSGSLPAGLSLNPASGEVTGTPTAMGTSTFTIQTTDSGLPAHVITKDLSLAVGPRGSESGQVVITGKSGAIVNTTSIMVTVP